MQLFQNSFEIVEQLIIPESQHLDSGTRQCFGSLGVIGFLRLIIMTAAIQFDRQLDIVAVKIKDEPPERMLAPKFDSAKPPTAQQMPEKLLGIGELRS